MKLHKTTRKMRGRLTGSLSARIAAVCAMTAALVCEGGTLTVKFGSAMEVIEGNVTNSYAKNATFTPTNIPCIYKMRMGGLSEGQLTFDILGSIGPDNIRSDYPHARFPQDGDDGWIRVALNPYPSTNTLITLTAHKVSNVYYADEKNGNDDWDGTAATHEEGTDHGPKQSLQAAHDAATTGSTTAGYPIVYVAPGVYSNGVKTTYSDKNQLTTGSSDPCKRRLVTQKGIGFIATGGVENTFIVGAPDPETEDGLGPNAVAGVHMSGNFACYLKGFTITGCYSPATQSANNQYGAACCAGAYRNYLLDCVVSNNFAGKYSATCYGTCERTKFLENTSSTYVTHMGVFISCLFAGNILTSGNNASVGYSLHNGAYTYFCTYDLRNKLNPAGRKQLHNTSTYLRCGLVYGLAANTVNATYWKDSQAFDYPVFADADARDYRLGALSPAIDASSYENDLNAVARSVMMSDIDGRMPVLHDGMLRLGAVWNDPPLPVTAIVSEGGGISVYGASEGTNVVSTADQITVTATDFGSRIFAGFEVNGEMVAAPSGSYTFLPSLDPGSVTTVRAIYDKDWYVDCVNGDDANPGTAALPKQTIRAATTNAVSGDVIHVAPGTYGALEGSQKLSAATTCDFRVIVPEGVTLIGTEGAENTLIVGAEATGDQIDNMTYKTGTNGVRCVCASNGAVVCGFTLTGGRGVGADSGNNSSAAFYSPTALGATIEDCIVSNNAAYYRTIYQAVVKRCRVIGNYGVVNNKSGAAGSACTWYSCIIDGNRGNGTLYNPQWIESCTFGKNELLTSGSSQMLFYSTSGPVINSLFLYSGDRFYGIVYATNCIFATSEKTGLSSANCSNCLFGTTVSVTDYKPAYGSKAIDAGSNEVARIDIASETDILGTPRALNGRIDIGAVEYDWRPTFSGELGRRFTVTYASPSVTTNATGGLLVPDGAVAGKIGFDAPYELAFSLTGGSLAVYVGGELAGESSDAGEQSIMFRVPDAAAEVRVVFTPDDDGESPSYAVLKGLASKRGLVFGIR